MSDDLRLRDGTRISKQLVRIIMSATPQDLAFEPSKIETHKESRDEKTGFFPIEVKSWKLPANFAVTYVKAKDGEGFYYYVISKLPSSDYIKEYPADSEVEAKQRVLEELKSYLRELRPELL